MFNPWKKIKELQSLIQIHKSEIDSLALQLEECRGNNSTLERWLLEVKQEREDLKDKLYKLSGIVREEKQQSSVTLQKLPIGKVPWRRIQSVLEENRRVSSIPKETIEEIEKEVGINNASKVS